MRPVLAFVLLMAATPAAAREIAVPPGGLANEAALAKAAPELAERLLASWSGPDRRQDLDSRFRLEMAAGRWAEADRSLAELHRLTADARSPQSRAADVQYQILIRAKLIEARDQLSFADAYARAFRQTLGKLDDRVSALVIRGMYAAIYSPGISLHEPIEENLQADLRQLAGKTSLGSSEALKLVRDYEVASAYRTFDPLIPDLVAEDDKRRYLSEEALVPTAGASVCARIMRPRGIRGRLPAILEFTIYNDPPTTMSEVRRTASNGYAAVEGLTRGKGCSPGPVTPDVYDGADADALIEWVARQPWSDGRVGMYGASYTGFTLWAALKHKPAALKAVMDAVTEAPGIDSPAEGEVVEDFSYYWPLYVTDNKTLDDKSVTDRARWDRMFRQWYVSGRAWRELDRIDGTPNPIWDGWMEHPSYDAFWQGMIPFGEEFASIDVPVLTTTGYYDGGEIGALYYRSEHLKYRPGAEHYLVIGPYDHHTGNRGTIDVLGEQNDTLYGGYRLDPAARVDFGELRYQWFDHIFKGAPKPPILRDKVNFETMGANAWGHAPSIAAMADERRRFFLSGEAVRGGFRLTPGAPTEPAELRVNLADRRDVDRNPVGGGVSDTIVDTANGLVFVSDPIDGASEIDGLFSGALVVVTNKKDFDFEIDLYELTPDGRYFLLPSYLARASFVADRTRRRLLTPGSPQTLEFTAGRITSRKLDKGSRLVVLISVPKSPYAQINYGSGKDVSDETVADAGDPLTIRFLPGSFIEVPLRR